MKQKAHTEIKLDILSEDFEILDKWGFCFDLNIRAYLHDIAEQLREAEKEGCTP